MMRKVLSLVEAFRKQPHLAAVSTSVGIFIFMLAYLQARLDRPYYYDAANYWKLADSFTSSGHFSLLNFVFQLRGYLFPLMLHVVKWQASLAGMDARLLFAVYSALLFTLLAGTLIPWFLRTVFRWETGVAGSLGFAFLLLIFWRGHFQYPLTDFPAFAILLLGLGLLVRSFHNGTSPLWSVLIGLLFGALINIRPIYQASLLVVFVLALVGWSRGGWKSLLVRGALAATGFVIILLPQFLNNHIHFNVNTPLVQAKYYGDKNLYIVQLFQGLKIQKYETNVGDNYPVIQVRYSDPLFEKIPKNERTDWSLPNYLQILKKHPLDVAISYFRHAFNGMDILYPTPYVNDMTAGQAWFSLVNYLVWFLCLYYFAQEGFSGVDAIQVFATASLLAPVALSIPTALEVRFFLPLYALVYGAICYKINYRDLLASFRQDAWHAWRFAILGLLWILTCFTLSAGTVAAMP